MAKAGDVQVEVDMWNGSAMAIFDCTFWKKVHNPLFEWLCHIILVQFKVNALQSFVCNMTLEHGWVSKSLSISSNAKFVADYKAEVKALNWVGKSSFWNWDDSSSILFWHWPREIRKECRNGCKICVKGPLP